ncbi:MAG TPA: hypothetical protein VGP42_07255, partial [Stellaceae bacterium]|nr:hypothetical protein [Stellaceae bacterium]
MTRARLLIVLVAIFLLAADKSRPESSEHDTTVPFTITWAKRLRGFHSLADLQRAAGVKGKASDEPGDNGEIWTQYHWRSLPLRVPGAGYML